MIACGDNLERIWLDIYQNEMFSTRQRVAQSAIVLLTVIVWAGILALAPAGSFHTDPKSVLITATPPLLANLAIIVMLVSEWSANRRSVRNSQEGALEVIPIERWKPTGKATRKIDGPVVIVQRKHIRRVQQLSAHHQKRRSLGLPEHGSSQLNKRRPSGWHRRIIASKSPSRKT